MTVSHMPKIETTIADVKVRYHTFAFVTPAMTDNVRDGRLSRTLV
jgi:hypothetical protein